MENTPTDPKAALQQNPRSLAGALHSSGVSAAAEPVSEQLLQHHGIVPVMRTVPFPFITSSLHSVVTHWHLLLPAARWTCQTEITDPLSGPSSSQY